MDIKMKNKIGKIFLLAGAILFIVAVIHTIVLNQELTMSGTVPPLPVGIGGTVKYQNGTYVPDGVTVTARNLESDANNSFKTQHGYYAIGLPAYNGDRIKIQCYHNGMQASKIIIVDITQKTQWANLTLGVTQEQPSHQFTISWLFIPAILSMLVGIIYEKKKQ